MWKIDEDASFARCVLLDGREMEGDWWIVRPLGVLGSSGILMVQDRNSGNVAPLTSVMLLETTAGVQRGAAPVPARAAAPSPRPAEPALPGWAPQRLPSEAAAAASGWKPDRVSPESPAAPGWKAERLAPEAAARPALSLVSAGASRSSSAPSGGDWEDILRDDVPAELSFLERDAAPDVRFPTPVI